MAKDEGTIDEEDVRREHLGEGNVGRHWAYLAGVIVGALVFMIGLIALLGATGGG